MNQLTLFDPFRNMSATLQLQSLFEFAKHFQNQNEKEAAMGPKRKATQGQKRKATDGESETSAGETQREEYELGRSGLPRSWTQDVPLAEPVLPGDSATVLRNCLTIIS